MGVIVTQHCFKVGDLVWLRSIRANPNDDYYIGLRPSVEWKGYQLYFEDAPWFTALACVVGALWDGGRKHSDRHYYYGLTLDPELYAIKEHALRDLDQDPQANTFGASPRAHSNYPDFMLLPRSR